MRQFSYDSEFTFFSSLTPFSYPTRVPSRKPRNKGVSHSHAVSWNENTQIQFIMITTNKDMIKSRHNDDISRSSNSFFLRLFLIVFIFLLTRCMPNFLNGRKDPLGLNFSILALEHRNFLTFSNMGLASEFALCSWFCFQTIRGITVANFPWSPVN